MIELMLFVFPIGIVRYNKPECMSAIPRFLGQVSALVHIRVLYITLLDIIKHFIGLETGLGSFYFFGLHISLDLEYLVL